MALQFASEKLRNDGNIVYKAVSQDGRAIQFAGKKVRTKTKE